jgi:hypothetical protein
MLDKKIIEKYNMFTNVDAVFADHTTIVDAVPALKAQVLAFHNSYVLLDPLMEQLQLDTKGYAKAKLKARLNLSAIGASICGAIRSYAEDQGDPILITKAKYSPTALKEMRDLVLQQTGQAIYDMANGLAAALLPYGITSTELDSLRNAADKFTLFNPQVRDVKVERKTIRQHLFKRVADLNNMLRQKLDASMKVMQFNHSDFYDLYLNSRRNYTLGVRHEQPETEGITDKLATPPPAVPTDLEALSAALEDITAKNGNGVPA